MHEAGNKANEGKTRKLASGRGQCMPEFFRKMLPTQNPQLPIILVLLAAFILLAPRWL